MHVQVTACCGSNPGLTDSWPGLLIGGRAGPCLRHGSLRAAVDAILAAGSMADAFGGGITVQEDVHG